MEIISHDMDKSLFILLFAKVIISFKLFPHNLFSGPQILCISLPVFLNHFELWTSEVAILGQQNTTFY